MADPAHSFQGDAMLSGMPIDLAKLRRKCCVGTPDQLDRTDLFNYCSGCDFAGVRT
jgi:hypothetical protein